MRIQPITTTNNNTSFKKLRICCPEKWDLDILEAVVKNTEIKTGAQHLNTLQKDLFLVYSCIGKDFFSIGAATGVAEYMPLCSAKTKAGLLDKLAKFNFKSFWNQQAEDRAAKEKRNLLLKELDDFNNSLVK